MHSIPKVLKIAVLALLYVLTARFSLSYFSPDGSASVFFMASGLAIATLLLGGRDYFWSVLLGALALNLLQGKPLLIAVIISLGSCAGAYLGAWLLNRKVRFDVSLQSLRDYLLLVCLGGGAACLIPALIGTLALLFAQMIEQDVFFTTFVYWWMGDTLGVLLIAPLILAWVSIQRKWQDSRQVVETLLIILLSFVIGQNVFLGWFQDSFGGYPKNYWIFLFVTWAAVRIGSRATTLILFMTAVQIMEGSVIHAMNVASQ